MDLMICFINIIFMMLLWNWSKAEFEAGNNSGGWINLVLSAVNGASVMMYVF